MYHNVIERNNSVFSENVRSVWYLLSKWTNWKQNCTKILWMPMNKSNKWLPENESSVFSFSFRHFFFALAYHTSTNEVAFHQMFCSSQMNWEHNRQLPFNFIIHYATCKMHLYWCIFCGYVTHFYGITWIHSSCCTK